MTRRARARAAVAALLLQSCTDAPHERFVEATIALAGIQAEEGDPRCRQEPACGEALAALRAIPAGHRDQQAAAKLLASIERARAAAAEPALDAARRAAERLAPGDPRDALPRDLPLPGAEEVPGFLQGTPSAGATGADATGADAAGAGAAGADAAGEGRTEDFGGAPEGVEPTARVAAGAFAAPTDDEEEPVDPEIADAPDVSRARLGDAPCAKERAEVERLKEALARALADDAGVAHVGDPAAWGGLSLQRRMKRCAEHPDDPGCAPPKTSLSLDEAEAAGRGSSRTPDEVEAGNKAGHETSHDPALVTAERTLRACLAAAR